MKMPICLFNKLPLFSDVFWYKNFTLIVAYIGIYPRHRF